MGAVWLLGVTINLAGSILINLGTNLMKLGHNKRAARIQTRDIDNRISIRRIREWQIGVALFSLGNIANFISFGYAAQSLLAAIGCVQFVSNVFFASLVLKEQVSWQVIRATSCIVGGCILLVSFGSHSSSSYTYRDLLRLYGQPVYICYMAIGAAVVVVAYAAYCRGQKIVQLHGAQSAQLWAASLPILYCMFSAIIGTQSVLFSKTLAVLLRATFDGDNQLDNWFTWLVLPAFLLTAVFWVTRLNKGLKMFPAMIIVPNLQISWTLFSILSGMLYFKEYHHMKALHAAMFVIGVSVMFIGVYLLTKASAPQPAAIPAEHSKTKVAYAVHTANDDHLHLLGAASGRYSAGAAEMGAEVLSSKADAQAGLLPPPGQEDKVGNTARASPNLHSLLGPGLDLDDEDELHVYQREDERSLLGANSTSSLEADQSQKHTTASFSLSRAISNLRLQQLWPGRRAQDGQTDTVRTGAGATGQGVQVLPDFAPTGTEGAAEAAAMHRQHQWRRARHRVAGLSQRFAGDFDLDETAAARLSLGLGDDPNMPGVSLFTLPVLDLHRSLQDVGPLSERYGVLPTCSQAGAVQSQAGLEANPAGSLSSTAFHSDGTIGAGAAAAIRKLNREQEMVALGANTGINPLANALDVGNASISHQASADGLLTSVRQNLREIHANIRDLTASIQTASSSRGYARMQSKEGMGPIAGAALSAEGDSMQ